MANFRDYQELIRNQVKEISQKDENWDWSVKGISKNRVKIRWTYLDYCEETNNCFFLKLDDENCDEGESLLTCRLPDDEFITGYIVSDDPKKFWQESYEKAIKSALNVIFNYAYSRY